MWTSSTNRPWNNFPNPGTKKWITSQDYQNHSSHILGTFFPMSEDHSLSPCAKVVWQWGEATFPCSPEDTGEKKIFFKHLSHPLSFTPHPLHHNQRSTWMRISLKYVNNIKKKKKYRKSMLLKKNRQIWFYRTSFFLRGRGMFEFTSLQIEKSPRGGWC